MLFVDFVFSLLSGDGVCDIRDGRGCSPAAHQIEEEPQGPPAQYPQPPASPQDVVFHSATTGFAARCRSSIRFNKRDNVNAFPKRPTFGNSIFFMKIPSLFFVDVGAAFCPNRGTP